MLVGGYACTRPEAPPLDDAGNPRIDERYEVGYCLPCDADSGGGCAALGAAPLAAH